MADTRKTGFRTVPQEEEEDYGQKLRAHRLKILKRTIFVILFIALAAIGTGLFLALRQYTAYDVTSSVERLDTDATNFAEFRGNILKYSNDGAFYTDLSNELIWNQTYELAEPAIDICGDYLVIYDKGGSMIYIMSVSGPEGSVETTMPISQVCVAEQGTIAVLMQKDGVGHLALYDRSGENLAQGAIHGEKGGYPIAIALSKDAIKLAVSMLDINDGIVKSTVAFYNFGSVGQNVTDHCVGINSFPDMVIPEIEFVTNDRLAAIGDTAILLFEGTQKPQLTQEITLEREVKSVFYNEEYIGVICSNNDEAVTHHLYLYDAKGKIKMETDFDMEYEQAELLPNGEICIRNENTCAIYTARGTYKFYYEFEKQLYCIIPGATPFHYSFVLDGETQKIRLK